MIRDDCCCTCPQCARDWCRDQDASPREAEHICPACCDEETEQ